MQTSNLDRAQEALYIWLSNFEKKSYTSIKQNCDYLNIAYKLGFEDYAVWYIFYPLLNTGVIDHVGNGYFALTSPICYYMGDEYICTNIPKDLKARKTSYVGVYRVKEFDGIDDVKVCNFNAISVLKSFPSIESVVDGFPKSIEDLTNAEYYNWRTRKGVTKRLRDGVVRFFSIPDTLYQREIPSKNINPEAFSIAYCYGRVINNEDNGRYDSNTKTLIIPAFATLIMTYRVLFLETLLKGKEPKRIGNYYYFYEISKSIVKELNRIYCNSIKYE